MALEARVLLSRLKAKFVKVRIRAMAMELREDYEIEEDQISNGSVRKEL